MRYTKRERRLAVLAVMLAVMSTALLGLYLIRGETRPPESTHRAREPGQTAAASRAPTTSQPRVLTTEYSVRGRWKGGFNVELVITNTGSQPVEGWTVRLQLPAGVAVTQAWAADFTQTAAALTLRSQPWNTYLAPGAAIRLGFEATGTAASPSSCRVNGSPC
jgi:hypothetical protein